MIGNSSKSFLNWFWQVYLIKKMVIWKERQHDEDDATATRDAGCLGTLRGCGILKLLRTPSMVSHPHLLEYILQIWIPEQQ